MPVWKGKYYRVLESLQWDDPGCPGVIPSFFDLSLVLRYTATRKGFGPHLQVIFDGLTVLGNTFFDFVLLFKSAG